LLRTDPALRKAIGVDALAADVPRDIQGIDAGPSPTPYERAERLAASAYGAKQSFFLTNGATQGNHALCLAMAGPGTHVVAQRNSHASIVDGLVLSGGTAGFVMPEYDHELGITHCITAGSLERALGEPASQGRVRGVTDVLRNDRRRRRPRRGRPRTRRRAGGGQAWGPHLGFHPELPRAELALGVDAMLTSTHKIAGSLTQSAILADSGRVDIGAVARMLRLLRSTSPVRRHGRVPIRHRQHEGTQPNSWPDQQAPVALNPQGGSAFASGRYDSLACLVG
jgi:lysine decarboxylase